MTEQNQQRLGTTLWQIADQLRGAMNADDFRDSCRAETHSPMPKHPSSVSTAGVRQPADDAALLTEIKARVQAARVRAGLAANRELLSLYWDIGLGAFHGALKCSG